MNPTDLIDRSSLRTDVPDFAPGDTLKVHVRVVEGNRERVQVFQGAVIRRQGSSVRETFINVAIWSGDTPISKASENSRLSRSVGISEHRLALPQRSPSPFSVP